MIQVHIDKLEWVATIDVRKRLDAYLNGSIGYNNHDMKEYKEMQDFYKNHLLSLTQMKMVQMTFCLNDDAEILVRLKPKLPDVIMSTFDKEMKKMFHTKGEFDDD